MSNLFSSGGAGNVGFSGETLPSLKFNDDESQYLSWTPAAAGNRKTWTWSGWVKRGNLGATSDLFGAFSGSTDMRINFESDDKLYVSSWNGSGGRPMGRLITSQVFRDVSAWYHIVVAVDTTQATASDRLSLYINGVKTTSFTEENYPATQNQEWVINDTNIHYIGTQNTAAYFDGYLSDIHFIDGQALDASSFGQFTNGYWKKKNYSGTYGTNGFHLTFEDDVVSEGFNTVTYRGTGADQSISGLGFEPDFVWAKERSSTSTHMLADSVRGAGKQLESSTTGAEITSSAGSRTLSSFDADGFSVEVNNQTNENGQTYVAWAWDAGSGSPVSNTDGSITSTVKANPDYGFSIVSYTGDGSSSATVGHGLAVAPSMVIVKRRNASGYGWNVYHSAIGASKVLFLNSTAAEAGTSLWNSTAPTSSVFNLGASSGANGSGGTYIAYCFHSVAGYSSIGSYSGNGSTSGPTVTTGFRPAFVMVKRTDSTANWAIFDATRSTSNPRSKWLLPNLSNAEGTDPDFEFTDTGFNLVGTGSAWNASGGTYIYMAFADTREAAFWKDVSGQGNHWTPNNLDYRDSLIDTPTNNFATLQPTAFVNIGGANSAQSLSEGNLRYTGTTSEGRSTPATIRVTSGKYYAEATKTSGSGSVNVDFIVNDTRVAGKSTSTTGDIIMAAVDVDAGKYWSGLNGTWDSSGDPATGANPTGTFTANSSFTFGGRVYDTARVGHFNFGQDSTFSGATTAGGNTDANGIGDFAYAPPSGYLALCTANLPTPSIVDGSEHFNTVLYTGTGATQSITGVGFGSAPDLVWTKNRSSTASHKLYDSVRGVYKALESDTTDAETNFTAQLQSFDSDGFTVGSGGVVNNNGQTYAAWNWKAGGTAVSNTDGSITSQVSANTDAGFSIVSYTGNTTTNTNFTVGHGLGKKPDLIIIKNRDWASVSKGWPAWHSAISTGGVYLDNTDLSEAAAFNSFFGAQPTSDVFNVRADTSVSTGNRYRTFGRTDNYIAYCFANTDGYLKAGSYTGNGSSDGPFVYTGGRVQWLLLKDSSSGTSQWLMMDNARDDDNPVTKKLSANISDAENSSSVGNDSQNLVDFLSNGFKLRTSNGNSNASGGTFIYLAILESPLKFANAR